jgi:methionyl-tRNA formyltransferase
MAHKAAELLPAVLQGIANKTLVAQPQHHDMATFCSLIEKKDGAIAWHQSAQEIDAQIRAFDPWPLSWAMHGELELIILKAEALQEPGDAGACPGQVLGKNRDKGILIQTGKGILAVSKLQYPTKKALDWKDFLNGNRDFIGARLATANK